MRLQITSILHKYVPKNIYQEANYNIGIGAMQKYSKCNIFVINYFDEVCSIVSQGKECKFWTSYGVGMFVGEVKCIR